MSSTCNALQTALSKQGVASIPQDCCQIAGVTCASDNTTIVELQVGRDGGLPFNSTINLFEALVQITTLKRLEIRISASGSIPPELARLQDLEYLDLSHCNFSGPVPASFQNMVSLKHIDFNSNSLQSPLPDLSSLANLRYIDLGLNLFSEGLPSWLWKMTGLTGFYAFAAGFTGRLPDDISKLGDLVGLELSHNQLTGPVPAGLFNATDLRYLALSHNQLTGPLPVQVGQLNNLFHLDLSFNYLAGRVPATLNNLTSIGPDDLHCSLANNTFTCRENDLAPANTCLRWLQMLPYCSGASSFLPPATVAITPTASGNTPAPQTTSSIPPVLYACLPVLFLLGAAIAWVAVSRRHQRSAAAPYPSTAPYEQEAAMETLVVLDNTQHYHQPEYVLPPASQLTLYHAKDGESDGPAL